MNKLRKKNHTRTKIIATLGPSLNTENKIFSAIRTGVDVFRLNFSHGSYEQHQVFIDQIRQINEKHSLHACMLADLQGPKIRTGKVLNNEMILKRGDKLIFTTKSVEGKNLTVHINYSDFPKDVKKGDRILMDDGKLEVKVLDTNREDEVLTQVVYGGTLSSNKGINLPHTKVSLPSLTDKDLEDLRFALANNIEWVALSFVRSPDDIVNLRRIIEKQNKSTRIIAKIEKPEGLRYINEIIAVSDGIMVARGDLGVEVAMEELPLAQKNIINLCMEASKPVIIATQIMESMIENPKPTRAESNDVANAVLDGADALMLSGETSIGKYPVKVIEQMRLIIKRTEKHPGIYNRKHPIPKKSQTYLSDVLCYNSAAVAGEIGAKGIIGMTQSGYTGFKISSFRPDADIFIFSGNRTLLTSLNLLWGVRVFYYDKFISTDKTFNDVNQILIDNELVKEGDVVINLASMPIHEKARTNALKVTKIQSQQS